MALRDRAVVAVADAEMHGHRHPPEPCAQPRAAVALARFRSLNTTEMISSAAWLAGMPPAVRATSAALSPEVRHWLVQSRVQRH